MKRDLLIIFVGALIFGTGIGLVLVSNLKSTEQKIEREKKLDSIIKHYDTCKYK